MLAAKRVVFASSLLFALSDINVTAAEYKILEKEDQNCLEICEDTICNKIIFPQTYFEKAVYLLRDLDSDKVPEIIITETGLKDAVNVCSIIYSIEHGSHVIPVKLNNNDNGQLCNITFHDEKIVSNYRDAASWYEVVYRYENGQLIREMEDKNGESRSIFDKQGNVINHYLLDGCNNTDWWERKILTAKIVAGKARLYNSPRLQDESRMYLISGDHVVLKDFRYTDDLYYLVEYVAPKTKAIRKWIKANSIEKEDIGCEMLN
jgi:hypothetical protein